MNPCSDRGEGFELFEFDRIEATKVYESQKFEKEFIKEN